MIIIKNMLNKILILSLVIIFIANFDAARAEEIQSEEGKIYGGPGEYFVDIAGVTYGPYPQILEKSVNLDYKNWGFTYYTKYHQYDLMGEYFYVINGQKHGPYNNHTFGAHNDLYVRVSNNYYIYKYKIDDKYYININNEKFGPCDVLLIGGLSDTNYGFSCHNESGGDYVYINGEKFNHKSSQYFQISNKSWAYSFDADDGIIFHINGDYFGPYDDVRSFKMLSNVPENQSDSWVFGYEKDGEFFILSSNNAPYKLPLNTDQAKNYDQGIFYDKEKYIETVQCHFNCVTYGRNDIELKKDSTGWSLQYYIDGELINFPLGAENTKEKIYDKTKGKIILLVENKGEAYYINPSKKHMRYLGRPNDALDIMKQEGVGISEKDFKSFNGYAPSRLSGLILLRVEANGEAYYVNPIDLKMHYLGRPHDAFNIMKTLGLGISNINYKYLFEYFLAQRFVK